MRITFKDDEEEGCACHCGEYRQNIRGYFETEHEDGSVDRKTKKLTSGISLEEHTFHEDGNSLDGSEYGHRSHPPKKNSKSEPDDLFLPDQATGCHYKGNDMPSMGTGIVPGEANEVRRAIFLEFEGRPGRYLHGSRCKNGNAIVLAYLARAG